jgi:hypothetical protein
MSSREETEIEDEVGKYFKRPHTIKYIQLLKEQLFNRDELSESENDFVHYIISPGRARETKGVSYVGYGSSDELILDEPTVDKVIKRLDLDNPFYSLSDSPKPANTEDLLTNLKDIKMKLIDSLNESPPFFINVKKAIMGNYIYSKSLLDKLKRVCENIKGSNDELCIFDIYFEVLYHCYGIILTSLERKSEIRELEDMRNSSRLYKINIDYTLEPAIKTHISQIITDAIYARERQLETSSRTLFGGKRKKTKKPRKTTKTRKPRKTRKTRKPRKTRKTRETKKNRKTKTRRN